jgi:integrase
MKKRIRKRQYGTGDVMPPRSAGGSWSIRWREGGQRRFLGGLPSRELAEKALQRVTLGLALERVGLPPQAHSSEVLGELATGFLARRLLTHRAGALDGWRWRKHMASFFDHLAPNEVQVSHIRAFVESKLSSGLSSGTVAIMVALLSSLFQELLEDKKAKGNPAHDLPRSLARLLRPSHDPRTTPFIEKLDDVRRIYDDLPSPFDVAYAVGAMGGLRTGEVFALRWPQVDLVGRRIHVRESWTGRTKNGESRVVPILDGLLPVLKAWRLKTEGQGLLFRSPRSRTGFFRRGTPGPVLAASLERLELARPGLGWYEATRHTFASHWVLAGGSITQLKEILGHYSVVMTERYAHLRTDLFPAEARSTISLSLEERAGRLSLFPIEAQATQVDGSEAGPPRAIPRGKGSKRTAVSRSARQLKAPRTKPGLQDRSGIFSLVSRRCAEAFGASTQLRPNSRSPLSLAGGGR